MSRPLFSFIIPNYNYGHYLAECIDSCLAQDVDSEIIVVDGGSTDDTVKILESYGERIRWVSEKDNGQSDALHKGILKARGKYIAWINSDDYYENSGAFETITEHVMKNPETDFIYGDVKYVRENGELYRYRSQKDRISLKSLYTNLFECIVQPEVIFSRELYLEAGGVDLNYHYAMDLDLWIRILLKANKLHYIQYPIACARLHPDAKTQKHIRKSIRETMSIQKNYKGELSLSFAEQLKIIYMRLKVELYYIAVKMRVIAPSS